MILEKYILKGVFLPFVFMTFIFTSIVILADFFVNLFTYIENNVLVKDIIYAYYLYLPRAIVDSLVLSFLFAVSNFIGSMAMKNEILAIYSCGISFFRLIFFILFLSFLLSLLLFFLDNFLIIKSLNKRELFLREKMNVGSSSQNVVIVKDAAREVFSIFNYDLLEKRIDNIIYIKKDENYNFLRRYDIQKAFWREKEWVLFNVREFFIAEDKLSLKEKYYDETSDIKIDLSLDTLNFMYSSLKTLTFSQLLNLIYSNKGEIREDYLYLDYYNRIFMSFRLILLSALISLVSLFFKKNIFILSLASSVSFTLVYVIMYIMFNFLGELSYLNVFLASSMNTIIFLAINIFLYYKIKSF